MHAIYPDASLSWHVGRAINVDWVYHLFTNNLTPDRDTVLGDFTEAAWTGYAVDTAYTTDWTMRAVASHKGSAEATDVTFNNTSGGDQVAYGYYVTDTGGTQLIQCGRFDDAPVTIPDGDSYSFTPRHGDRSGFSS